VKRPETTPDHQHGVLVDSRGIQEWLGVTRHGAEMIMDELPLYRLGRRNYVKTADVLRLIEEKTTS
jgi:hypothetical protein